MKPFNIVFLLVLFVTNFVHGSENWAIEPISNFEINSNLPNLGGLSAIEITEKGRKFVFISDRGYYFKGQILRNTKGFIEDLNIIKSGPLLNSTGNKLSGRNTDSESLTTTKKQGFYISFESNHRIMFHESLNAAGTFLPRHNDFQKFDSNKGLEAIAANSKGEIFAIPEEPLKGDTDFPIYKLSGKTWSVFSRFPRSGAYLVTDAVFLPDNDLLILERDFNWEVGFKMQLRIIHINSDTITGQTNLLSLNSGLHNHEGLSLWQDNYKNFFITSISDNNFLPFVSSEIKEFSLYKIQEKKLK